MKRSRLRREIPARTKPFEVPGAAESMSGHTMAVTSFFSPGPAPDPLYNRFGDDERAEVRAFIEDLWVNFQPLCGDPHSHFLCDARANFHQRTWELLLAGVLANAGVPLSSPGRDAPDLLTEVEGRRVWIEAVAPTAGSGPDEAKRVFVQRTATKHGERGIYHIDHDKMTIRYTAALRDKASLTRDPPSQYVRFVERGAVSTNDAFVVAINAGAIDDADLRPDVPGIIPAVFPVGEPIYLMPIGGGEPRVEVPLRPSIKKASGASVPTTAFTSDEFVNVSAVIFTPYGIWNADGVSGREFVTVHNPLARVPLPRGTFPFGREYWVEVDPDGMGQLREHHYG